MKSIPVLLSIGIIFLATHVFAQQINNLNLAIEGEAEVTQDFKEFLLNNPEFKLSDSGSEYHINLVEPDPSIDYRILDIQVDSNVEYMLRLINPVGIEKIEPVYDEFVEELLREFKISNKSENE